MKLTAEQIEAFAKQMAALASIFAPGSATAISALIAAGTELNAMIKSIKENDPEMWAKVVAETNTTVDAYLAGLNSE